MEFIDDLEVSKELLKTAENFLKEKGMEAVHGPLGFTNLDNQGLLIEGFDYLPSIASVMHFLRVFPRFLFIQAGEASARI